MKIKLAFILLLIQGTLWAQTYRKGLREGNELYSQEKYDEAEVRYRKAIEEENTNPERGIFNLGDALYKQERYEEAGREFARVAGTTQNKEIKSKALHNLGNSLVNQQKFKEAIEAYKNSLKLNPQDDETRYNLAKALKKLQQQQQQQQQDQNKDQKDQKDQQQQDKDQQQQNQKDQSQQQDSGDNQDQKQQPEDGRQPNQPKDEGEQPKPRQGQISREDAERLLKALSKDEQDVQKKVNKEKVPAQPIKTDKDW